MAIATPCAACPIRAGRRSWRRSRELAEIGTRLGQIDSGDLSGASRLNHQFLSRLISEAVEQTAFDFNRIAFQNDDGFHTLGDYLGRTTSIRSRDDADAWLARLEALPDYYARSIANLRRGIDTQFTQPKIVVDRVLDVARKQAGVTAENSPLLLPFGRMPPTIPAAVQAGYRNQAVAILRDRVGPAQRTFAAFLAQDYGPAARPAISWRATPEGESSYRFLVRRETTTSLTPDEIHRLGLAEVARIRGLMDGTIKESGYSGYVRWLPGAASVRMRGSTRRRRKPCSRKLVRLRSVPTIGCRRSSERCRDCRTASARYRPRSPKGTRRGATGPGAWLPGRPAATW